MNLHEALADELYVAWRDRLPVAPPTQRFRALEEEDAYRVQSLWMERRAREERPPGAPGTTAQGDHHDLALGYKVGLTSLAVQRQLGVDRPDFGVLLPSMAIAAGRAQPADALIAPKVEAEIAFLIGRPLPERPVRAWDILRATEAVAPAIEVIDSRVADWKIRFEDTIADNASSAAFVIGNQLTDPRSLDLRVEGMALRKGGQTLSTGAGAACLGHPLEAVAWLANTLRSHNNGVHRLRPGHIVLSGALGPTLPASAGDVFDASFGTLGSVSLRFT